MKISGELPHKNTFLIRNEFLFLFSPDVIGYERKPSQH